LQVTDIQVIADLAHAAGAVLMVDNTIGTPVFQRPLTLGADLVLHATTKYLNGHHDVLGGAVIAREQTAFWERIAMIQHIGGAVPSPFDCWMIQRGLQTLPYRMQAHAANAMHVANFLAQHPRVERVLYPGLATHEDHILATRQMSGFGALMSFLVKGDEAAAMSVAANVKLIVRATSFGGPHTQIEHRASIEHEESTTPRNLLRLAVGLEHADDIIADLDQAMA
jgi:cystathionine gamma-synthase